MKDQKKVQEKNVAYRNCILKVTEPDAKEIDVALGLRSSDEADNMWKDTCKKLAEIQKRVITEEDISVTDAYEMFNSSFETSDQRELAIAIILRDSVHYARYFIRLTG